MLALLIAALSLAALTYGMIVVRAALAARIKAPQAEPVLLGAVTNFFDTLGIGSFVPTMAWMRFRRMVPDRLIPMTMLVGYILPSMAQALIFLSLLGVKVDPVLLILCIVAMVVGALVGVPIAARAPVRAVRAIVGLALLVAAFFYTLSNLGLMPVGGTATTLEQPWFAIAVAVHLGLGVLVSFGVGNYAPTLAMLSLFEMDPRLAFPIMASAASFAGCAAAARLVKVASIDTRIAVGLTLGAIPAVLVAAFIVKEMPLEVLRWLVAVVVAYGGVTLLVAAARREQEPQEELIERAVID